MSNKYKMTSQHQKERIIYEIRVSERKAWQPVAGNHLYKKIKEQLREQDGKTPHFEIRLKNLPEYICDQLTCLADVQTDFDDYVKITMATMGRFLEMRTSRIFDKEMERAFKTDYKTSTDNFAMLMQVIK